MNLRCGRTEEEFAHATSLRWRTLPLSVCPQRKVMAAKTSELQMQSVNREFLCLKEIYGSNKYEY
jgi:hypothetical protein